MPNIVKLPGLIDAHVHLREPGATQKEDFKTGTKAAIAGGFTTVLDMPNNPISTITPERLQEKIDLAKGRIFADVGFHFGAGIESIQYFPEVADKVFGLKVYMNQTTGDLLMEDDEILEKVFSSWLKDKIIMVHAEGETLQKAISLAKKFGNRLHVCHVSLGHEVDLIKQAKSDGLRITCEISCHHLFLTDKDRDRLGPYGIMKPPLPSKEDQDILWKALIDGTIDIVASDHAPHTKEEKENSEKPPFGVPGLETTLPLLLTAVNEGRLTLERVVELCSDSPKKIFDVPEQEDTYIEADMDEPYTINNKLYTKAGWTPFAGMKVKGKVKKVVLRGQVAFDGENIFGPYGKVL